MSVRGDRWLLVGALIVWCAAIVIQLVHALPLGHDEAAFVLGARRWLAGAPEVWLYRSVGTELLAMPGVALGASAPWIRVVPALMTLLVPLGACALARAAFPDRRLGGWAAAVLATAQPMLLQASAVLGDLPAAGLILVGLAILVRELSRPEGPTWRTVLAAGALAAAFYVRYGSAPALAAIAVATATFYSRVILRPRTLAPLAGAVVLLALPYVWWSCTQTGSIGGLLAVSAGSTRLDYVGQGLVTYLTANPLAYYGAIVAPVMLLGVAGVIALRHRAASYLAFIAIATLVALGLRSHAQPRYAFLVVALLVVVGVAVAERLVRRLAPVRGGMVAVLIVVVTWLGGLGYVVRASAARSAPRDAVVALGEAIRRHSGGRPCAFIAVRVPQLAYYSGCVPSDFPDAPAVDHVYVVSLPALPAHRPLESVPLAGTNGAVVTAGP